MQMLNQKKVIKNKLKKSHLLLFGSFLVFFGILIISYNHLLKVREGVYADMRLAMYDYEVEDVVSDNEIVNDIPIVENVSNEDVPTNNYQVEQQPIINYDKYLGVLEIPKIGLKRGFYGLDSKYNNIEYNVTLVKGSSMPDVVNGNLILMAHSGDAYISFFAYLYRLNIGDNIYVTYNKIRYHYKIVNIYNVEKNGTVKIIRNFDKNNLTLITCTKDNQYSQTVYISELVS